jgi:hypothetical protein
MKWKNDDWEYNIEIGPTTLVFESKQASKQVSGLAGKNLLLN